MHLGVLDRLRWRTERRIKTEPDIIQRAGESAEFRLGQYLRAAGKKRGWTIYESLRVPQKEGQHRGEIDFVLLHGSDVFAVEQKHWAGALEIGEEGEFIQHRPNGTTQVHGDIKTKHERKTADLEHFLLQHHHAHDFGIHSWFVFTHPRFEYNATVDLGIDIINQKEIVERLEQSVNKPRNEHIASSLDTLGTWDEIEVHGGRTYKGDVLDLGLSVLLSDARALTHPLTLIEVSHKRSLLSLLTSTPSVAVLPASGNLRERLERHQNIRFHVVGDASPIDIPWAKVTRVHLSN